MPRHARCTERNFGWGKQIPYAGTNALRDHYRGHHATVATHSARWASFCCWLAEGHKIRDARLITREIFLEYGMVLRAALNGGAISVSYAHNIISSINLTMEALRLDHRVWLPPTAVLEQRRCYVRKSPPASLDLVGTMRFACALREDGFRREASVVELCRIFGLRLRECLLLDVHDAEATAAQRGEIEIVRGTKGGRGRQVPRILPVDEAQHAVLTRAVDAAVGGPNLIPAEVLLATFRDHVQAILLPRLARAGLGTVRDLRSSYACARYEALTGHPAPVVAGRRTAPLEVDHGARGILAQELGHERQYFIASYCGA